MYTLIRRRRRELGLTQKELADQLGTFQTHVSKWERGENIPTPTTLIQLARVLDTSLQELQTARKSALIIRRLKAKGEDND